MVSNSLSQFLFSFTFACQGYNSKKKCTFGSNCLVEVFLLLLFQYLKFLKKVYN